MQSVLTNYIARKKDGIQEPLEYTLSPEKDYGQYCYDTRRVIFSHSQYVPGFEDAANQNAPRINQFLSCPVIVLVRDPRDTIVSFYHHKMARSVIRARKKQPPHFDPGLTINEFVKSDELGIVPIVSFYNELRADHAGQENTKFMYYEDLKSLDLNVWGDMFAHLLGCSVDEDALTWSLDVNSFQNMKKRQSAHYNARDDAEEYDQNSDSWGRIRKGSVGGYKDELSEDTIEFCDDVVNNRLDDFFARYKTK